LRKFITISVIRITGIITVAFIYLSATAQHRAFFVNSTEADGLSDNHVHCFFKDKTGYVWIGTANGLNRYDGNTFKIYKPAADKKNHLSNGFVTAVSQDRDGNIWVATKKGLNRIDAATDTTEVVNITDTRNKITLSGESVLDVLPDGDNMWIALDTKPLLCYNTKTKQYLFFDFKKFLKDNNIEYTPLYHSIFKILSNRTDGLWLATTEGLVHFNKLTGAFTLVAGIALDEITFFNYEAANDKLYYIDERQILYSYDITAKKINTVSLDAQKHTRKYLMPYFKESSMFFVPVAGGLALIDTANKVVSFLQGDDNKTNTIFAGKINTVYKDRDGITWAGSEKGISKFVPRLNNSLHVTFPEKLLFDPEFSLKNIFYRPDKNEWLVASYADNTIWQVDNTTGFMTVLTKPAAYKNDVCYAFFSRNPDTVFLLCDGVLLTYYCKLNKWAKISLPAPWNEGTITCMEIDGEGNYWLGTRRKGLIIYNTQTKKIETLYKDIREANIIHALQYDTGNNSMWIGTYSTGLHRYNFADKSLKYIRRNDTVPDAIHASLINDLGLAGENIWAATVEGGLAKCNTADGDKKVINYDYKNGLPDNIVYSTAADEAGNIFFGTAKGIGMIGTDSKIRTVFNNQSGLPFTSFLQSIVCLPDGRIATAVDNSIYCFDTKALLQQGNTPVVINQINLNDSVLIKPSQVSFSHNQNSFQFSFAALDFITPGTIEYFYMLEGSGKDWISNGKQRSVRYDGLPPGTYTFKVKIKNITGEFSEEAAEWKFEIKPAFWQTWWFRLLCLLFITFLIFYFLRKRINAIKQREKFKRDYERKIAETEMQALRAQMNPHFMFNSLNSINNFILKNDPDNASGYLTKFSRLMRLILDNSRSEWVLLENELRALELYIELEAVRFDNAFTYAVKTEPDISIETVAVPPMIIQPYVENAIWHGLLHRKEPGGKLAIRVWKQSEQLHIEIEDNGVGREEAKRMKSKTATKQKSHGMKITAERMEIVNKIYNVNAGAAITDLKDEKGNDAGTKVLITLQYKMYDSHYSG
jgi:ligand-binding sensor domain-containing protein